MYRRTYSQPTPDRPGAEPVAHRTEEPGVDALSVLSIVAVIALGILIAGQLHRMHAKTSAGKPANLVAMASGSTFDPGPFMLNALLVPALDPDSDPLVWTDPRPIAQCGPATTVLVNRKPLVPGAPVGDAPFALSGTPTIAIRSASQVRGSTARSASTYSTKLSSARSSKPRRCARRSPTDAASRSRRAGSHSHATRTSRLPFISTDAFARVRFGRTRRGARRAAGPMTEACAAAFRDRPLAERPRKTCHNRP